MEASSGILLLAATVVALVWANAPFGATYHAFWDRALRIGFGDASFGLSLHDWVNDGLMALFFFVVGLEIKREILAGELATLKKAAFPFIAAFGGSLVPALIFFAFNPVGHASKGWGIPMATDIAFALGVLALLGDRVPTALKVFVAALAIVDDIFAVLVIAFFYTEHISVIALLLGFAGVGISLVAAWRGVRHPAVYAVIGLFTWFAILHSGVHATIAGILMALTIPTGPRTTGRIRAGESEAEVTRQRAAETGIYPLERMEHALQPWVSFFIMPVFALSNAGVHVLGRLAEEFTHPISLGVICGLLFGKPLGISLFTRLSSAWGLASPPESVSWKQIFASSWLCGIGFTMSLFIAGLAYSDPDILDRSKLGILLASVAAGIVGSLLLRASAGIRRQA